MIRIPIAWLDWFDLRRSIVVLALVIAATVFVIHRALASGDPGFGILAFAPLAAAFAAPALIGLFSSYTRWVHERIWASSQGTYRAFDDRPIRVVEVRGRLWFCSADVHAALDQPQRAGALRGLRAGDRRRDARLGDMLSNEGLVALFGHRTDRRALRLVAWAEGDVRRPWQKRRDAEQTPIHDR